MGIEKEGRFTGSQVNYYFICKRKLWLFSHNIELEPESDLVKLGKLLHENRYKRKMKEVQVDRIKVDFMESKGRSSEIRTPTSASSSDFQNSSEINASMLHPKVNEGQEKQRDLVIHEVKRSRKMQDAHLYQILYYMYYLKKNYGVNALRGVLHYPLLSQNVDVFLSEERIAQIEEALRGIGEVNAKPRPPEATWKAFCRSCAYCDLCWG